MPFGNYYSLGTSDPRRRAVRRGYNGPTRLLVNDYDAEIDPRNVNVALSTVAPRGEYLRHRGGTPSGNQRPQQPSSGSPQAVVRPVP